MNVSIIVPTYNDKEYLIKTLRAIKQQDAPYYSIEVIVVDNGSTDGTNEFLQDATDILYIREHQHLNSPYSCRNRGIEKAKGAIIVLLDATCIPANEWLKNGIEYLKSTGADIVGGNVVFDFEGKVTGAKLYDALTNIRMEESIKKGVAKTANLFIKREVFEKIGTFPEGIRSGADVRWTYKATSNGLRLEFCNTAVVYKPARAFKELIKKQWRVGKHQPLIWKDQGKKISIVSALKKIFVPVSPVKLKRALEAKRQAEMTRYFWSVLTAAQVVKWTMGAANLISVIKLKVNKNA